MEPHIPSARDYLDTLELRKIQFEELKRHKEAGRLSDEQFTGFETQFTKFAESPNTNPDLGATIRLLQLYPELAEKIVEIPVVVAPPKGGLEPEVPGKPFTLPDGQEVPDVIGKEKQLGDILNEVYLVGDHLRTVSGSELVGKIWGEDIDKKIGKARLSTWISTFKRKLAEKKWLIQNDAPLHTIADGQYRFAKMEEIVKPFEDNEFVGKIVTSLEEIVWESGPEAQEIEFSAEEKAVLARLLINRSQSPIKINEGNQFKLEFQKDEAEVCQRLYEAVYTKEDAPTNGHAEELRKKVLDKIEKLFKDERAEDKILELEGDIRIVLVGLYVLDKTIQPSYLFEFLKAGLNLKTYSNNIYDWIKGLIKYEADRAQRMQYATEVQESAPKIMFEKIEVDKTSEPVKTEQEAIQAQIESNDGIIELLEPVVQTPVFEPESKPGETALREQKPKRKLRQGPRNVRGLIKIAEAKGFTRQNTRTGEVRIEDAKGNYVTSIPKGSVGKSDMSPGTYHKILKQISEYAVLSKGTEN